MEVHLHIIGALLMVLALVHADFPRRFAWKLELPKLSLINKQMVQVHTFFIALTVMMIGALNFFYAEEITHTRLGHAIAFGLALFWSIRFIFQLFVYSSGLWKGKAFETSVHILFTIFWVYMSVVFWLIALS